MANPYISISLSLSLSLLLLIICKLWFVGCDCVCVCAQGDQPGSLLQGAVVRFLAAVLVDLAREGHLQAAGPHGGEGDQAPQRRGSPP